MADKCLGELYYKIGAKEAGLNKAIDTANAKTQSLTKSVTASAASFAKAAIPILSVSAAIAGVAAVSKQSMEAFKVQEAAERKLDAALKATGQYAVSTAGDLKAFAGAMQAVTQYGDEETIPMMANLISVGGATKEEVKALTPAIMDMASALDMDLNNAANLVAKTIGSSTNALSRYGIQIDMSGTKQEKLAELVANLNGKFGGTAQALSDADGGFKQLSNAIGDSSEILGGYLVNTARPMIKFLTEFITKANEAKLAQIALQDALMGRGADYSTAITEQLRRIQEAEDRLAEHRKNMAPGYIQAAEAKIYNMRLGLQDLYRRQSQQMNRETIEQEKAQREQAAADSVAAEQAAAEKRIAIQADLSAKMVDATGTAFDKINAKRIEALEEAKAAGIEDRETLYQINQYYDVLEKQEVEKSTAAILAIKDAAWNQEVSKNVAAWEAYQAREQQKELEEQNRAAIRIQILGTEEQQRELLIEQERQAFIDAGFSMDEADKLVQANITKRHEQETQKRVQSYMSATNQILGMASGFLGQMISINNQETQNKINNLNEAAMSEEDYQRAVAFFNWKGSLQAWKLQVMQAKLQIPQAMINAYTSTAAIPLIGAFLAPVMAAVAVCLQSSNTRQ